MDSLVFPLNSIRFKIESFSSWTMWLINCANSILKYLGITTSNNNYVCYTALTTLKYVILICGIWIVVVLGT